MTLDLDPTDLERAFGHAVASYEVEPIDPQLRIHSVTGGVFRVRAGDESLVVKVVRHGVDDDPHALWVSGADLAHRNYWKREWLAFDSGLLDGLPAGVRAPRTRLTTWHGDRECRIWMEDVSGRTGADLSDEDYRRIGHDLGTMQGTYAAGAAALPDDPWLSRHWLRGWVEVTGRNADAVTDDDLWRDGRLDAVRGLRAGAAEIWARREELLAIVESAPPTVVHLDFWPTNVIAADDGSTVAVDWSQIGIGAVAQDVDQMTLDPIWMQVRPSADPRDLERLVLDSYCAGLREAGFVADDATVFRWYAAAAAAHYVPMLGFQVISAADPEKVAAQERRHGRPFAEIAAARARAIERAVELGRHALSPAS